MAVTRFISTMESKCLVLLFLSTCLLLQCRAHPEGFRICFRQADKGSQYQGISSACSGYSRLKNLEWSSPFLDDTGGRSLGHKYQWRIEAGQKIPNYAEYRLCFWERGGISSQCKGYQTSCTGWSSRPTWTKPFHDNTDETAGGCSYSWVIQSRYYSYSSHFQVCRVCFKETQGGSQCQGTRESCSGWAAVGANPSWTLPFHDNTDNRSGGCTYNWYLDCTSVAASVYCPRDSPC